MNSRWTEAGIGVFVITVIATLELFSTGGGLTITGQVVIAVASAATASFIIARWWWVARHTPSPRREPEWVPGIPGIWSLPLVVPAAWVLLLVAYVMLTMSTPIPAQSPQNAQLGNFIIASIVIFFGSLLVVTLSVPANRRVGLTPDVLVFDAGIRKVQIRWADLQWSSQTVAKVATGPLASSAFVKPRLRMTKEQADRVREFMGRLPAPPKAPPPWISVYDPR